MGGRLVEGGGAADDAEASQPEEGAPGDDEGELREGEGEGEEEEEEEEE